jgi:DUF4097 and DUF4098 domain-containing protein YvlB
MTRCLVLSALLTVPLGVATALPPQSKTERDIERAAEQISRTVERSVEQAMRTVEQAMRSVKYGRYDGGRFQQRGDRIDTTFTFARSGVIDLSSIDGDITVTGWTRNEVKVHAESERGRLRWNFSSSRITIETELVRGRSGDTSYELSVPQGVRVILRSTSGDLSSKGTHGAVDANTTSGDIDVSDATDRVELQTVSGDVAATGLGGEVEVGSVSGDVEVHDVDARSLHAESTSGDLVLANVRSKDIAASTVSGEVQYKGTIESGGQYEFRSHSGTISLDIPANASARFSVETFSGELDSDFPVTILPTADKRRGKRIDFTLGGGDAKVVAETFSGDVEIRRASRR